MDIPPGTIWKWQATPQGHQVKVHHEVSVNGHDYVVVTEDYSDWPGEREEGAPYLLRREMFVFEYAQVGE